MQSEHLGRKGKADEKRSQVVPGYVPHWRWRSDRLKKGCNVEVQCSSSLVLDLSLPILFWTSVLFSENAGCFGSLVASALLLPN